jgi:hypothetical protein
VSGCPAHAEIALDVARDLGCPIEAVRALCAGFGRGPALLLPMFYGREPVTRSASRWPRPRRRSEPGWPSTW